MINLHDSHGIKPWGVYVNEWINKCMEAWFSIFYTTTSSSSITVGHHYKLKWQGPVIMELTFSHLALSWLKKKKSLLNKWIIREWMNERVILVSTGIKLPRELPLQPSSWKVHLPHWEEVSYPWKSGRPDTSYKKSFRKL